MSLWVPAIRAAFEPDLGLHSLTEDHLSLIATWLDRPHVARWWDPPEIGIASIRAHLRDPHIAPYLVSEAGRPVGYLQFYHANRDIFWRERSLPAETFGLDLFLGEMDALDRGLGARTIRLTLDHLGRQPSIVRVHIDPSPANARAIRTFLGCGFRDAGTIDTPDGPAAYMVLEPPSPGTG